MLNILCSAELKKHSFCRSILRSALTLAGFIPKPRSTSEAGQVNWNILTKRMPKWQWQWHWRNCCVQRYMVTIKWKGMLVCADGIVVFSWSSCFLGAAKRKRSEHASRRGRPQNNWKQLKRLTKLIVPVPDWKFRFCSLCKIAYSSFQAKMLKYFVVLYPQKQVRVQPYHLCRKTWVRFAKTLQWNLEERRLSQHGSKPQCFQRKHSTLAALTVLCVICWSNEKKPCILWKEIWPRLMWK